MQVCPDGYYVIHAQCSVHAADVEGSREELLHKVSAAVVRFFARFNCSFAAPCVCAIG
jgi:hypothetical protein